MWPTGWTARATAWGLSIDKKSIAALEGADGASVCATKTAATEANAYKLVLEAKRVLSRKGVPAAGRFLIASPEFMEVLMQDERFIKQGDLSQQLVQAWRCRSGRGLQRAGVNNMDYESTTRVASKRPPPSSSAAIPTGATGSWSGRCPCICRICPAPASTSARLPCRGARSTA